MNSRNAAVLLMLAAALELGGLCYLAGDRVELRTVSAADADAALVTGACLDHAPPAPVEASNADPVSTSSEALIEREAIAAIAVHGRIVGPRGEPVSDATLSWTPLADWVFAGEHGPESTRAATIVATSTWTTSDRDGTFRFADEPPRVSEHSSVLWVTHADYGAVSVVLATDRRAWPALAAIEMQPAVGLEVRVVDHRGVVAGATVEQVGFVPFDDAAGRAPTIEILARRALRRVATTARDGWTRLVPVAGATVLRASAGGRVSEPKVAPEPSEGIERLTLTLRSTFVVSGHVFGLEAITEPGCIPRITCHAQRGNVLRPLESIEVSREGRFGPVSVPILEGADVRFVLQGAPLIPKAFLARAPQPGSTVQIDFTAEAGHDVWFKIVDPELQTLPQAEAVVRWVADGIELDARARTRADGYTVVRGAPPGIVVCEARAKGYHSTQLEPEMLPEREPSTRGVMLHPAGRLRGRCTHAGKPVRDFEVTVWPANASFNFIRHEFTDREDGTFEIADAPLGMVCALAASADFAPAEVARVEAKPDAAHEIVFELTDPVRGRGKVVDHASGAPLPDARVQLFSSDGYDVIASLGPARQVDASGSFEMDGFAAGRMICAVSAPGHATTRIGAQGVHNETIELGVIALVPKQPLEIHIATEPGTDASEFAVSLIGAELVPPTPFSPQGLVRIDSLSPGSYEMHVLRGADLVYGAYPLLEPEPGLSAGAPWRLDVPLASPHTVTIELTGDEARPRSGDLGAVVSFRGPKGEQMERYVPVSAEGRATCKGVLAGEVSVSVFDAHRDVLTTQHSHLDTGARELHVVVPLPESQDIFRVRVVDGHGAGIAGVRVQLARAGHGAAWSEETTGADGECAFRGIEAGRYLAHLFHQTRGRRVGVPVDLARCAPDVTSIELAADARVEALFVDGEVPQAGLSATLYDAEKSIAFAVIRSNESGIARADGLADAAYLIEVDEPDYFPVCVPVRSTYDGIASRIDVRRRGDLELELRSPSGKACAGVRVELVALETETDVATWWKQGLVLAPVQGLKTDVHGRLQITGLPHGAYRWRADGSSGPVTGVVTVPPANIGRATLMVP